MKTKMSSRILSLMLCILMCVSLFPAQVLAEEADFSESTEEAVVETEPSAEEPLSPATDNVPAAEEAAVIEETVSNEAANDAATSGTCGAEGNEENVTWSVVDGTLTISGSGDMADFRSSGPWYTEENMYAIHHVVVENGVTSIGSCAFSSLYYVQDVQVAETVTRIGERAFSYISYLESIEIPDGVEEIESYTFEYCNNLASVKLPDSLKKIGDEAFWHCAVKTLNLPEGVVEIGERAYAYCHSLTSVSFPSSLKKIGTYAFGQCDLQSIAIPAALTDISESAFASCTSLTSITVSEDNTAYCSVNNALLNKAQDTLILAPLGVTESYEIPAGVKTIGASAFEYAQMTEVTIPDSVTDIGKWAFQHTLLKTVTIPDSVKNIEMFAFADCYSLTDIYVSKSVESLGQGVFSGDTELSAINVSSENTTFSSVNGVLYSADGKTLMQCPAGYTGAYDIPEGVEKISGYAFEECAKLTGITFPNSLKTIGEAAFMWCTGLAGDLVIPANVTTVDSNGFRGCSSLTSVTTLGNPSTHFGSYSLSLCTKLTSVTFTGDVPIYDFSEYTFQGSTLTVYYPEPCEKWAAIAAEYGDENITWVAKECEHNIVTDPAVAATCTTAGLTEGNHCSKCNTVITAQEPVEALGHDYAITETQATCTEKGVTTYTCTRCGDSYMEEADALGHDYAITETQATCTEKGVTTYTCTRCGASYTKEADALGHSYTVTARTAATCTEKGSVTYTCSRCGNSYTEETEALGHSYAESARIAATCTEQGSIIYTCSRCGSSYTEETDALGHDYFRIAWSVASCTEPGSYTYQCSRCEDSYKEEIAALGHDYVEQSETAATCTEAGYITYACSRCGNIYKKENADALGHDYVDGVCTRCGASEEDEKPLSDRLRDTFASGEWTMFEISGDEVLEESVILDGSGQIYLGYGASLTLASGVSLTLNGVSLYCVPNSLLNVQVGSTLTIGSHYNNDGGYVDYYGILNMRGGRVCVNGTLNCSYSGQPWIIVGEENYSEDYGNQAELNNILSLADRAEIGIEVWLDSPEAALAVFDSYSGYGRVSMNVSCTESESTLHGGTVPSNASCTLSNYYADSDDAVFTVTIPAGETVTVDGELQLDSNIRLVVDGTLIINDQLYPYAVDQITVNGTLVINDGAYIYCWDAAGSRRIVANDGGIVKNYGTIYPEDQAETLIGGEGTIQTSSEITEVALTIPDPVAGEPFPEVTGVDGCSLNSAEWTSVSSGYYPAGEKAQVGTEYMLYMTFTAEEGYAFPDDGVSVTVNGNETDSFTGYPAENNDDWVKMLIVYYYFPETEAPEGTAAIVYNQADASCYNTLSEAFAAAGQIPEDDESTPLIRLMQDVEETIALNQGEAALDLNGHTITGNLNVSGSGYLVIEDNSVDDSGTIAGQNGASAVVCNSTAEGGVEIYGGSFMADGVPAVILNLEEGSSAAIMGGTFGCVPENVGASEAAGEENADENSAVSVAALALASASSQATIGLLVNVNADTSLTIADGNFAGTDYGVYIKAEESTGIQIVGGTFSAAEDTGAGLAVESSTGSVTVNDISTVGESVVDSKPTAAGTVISYVSGDVTVTHEHVWNAETGTCSICGQYCNHTYKMMDRTEPTHTEPGLTGGYYCPACGYVFSEPTEIPAIGHLWTAWAYDASTGLKTRHCTTCEDVVETCLAGDVYTDGTVNLKDLLVLKKALAAGSFDGLDQTMQTAGDINCDGVLNLKDLLLLKQKLAGINA